MKKLTEKLYQMTTYIQPMDFTIHQYLLATNPAILFATGTYEDAKKNLPFIKEILDGWELKYIFVSHLESDECGGLSVFLSEYPEVTVLCSSLCGRELPGYGYKGDIKVCHVDEDLIDGELELQFIDYPSEVHLQNGLLCFEKNSGLFYSSDLMQQYGHGAGQFIQSHWKQEVEKIDLNRVPNEKYLHILKKKLLQINPQYIAVGHGFCIKL